MKIEYPYIVQIESVKFCVTRYHEMYFYNIDKLNDRNMYDVWNDIKTKKEFINNSNLERFKDCEPKSPYGWNSGIGLVQLKDNSFY